MPNSTQTDEIIRLTAKIAAHEKRVATLESSLSALSIRIAYSDYGDYEQSDLTEHIYFREDGSKPVKPTSNRRGRRPRIQSEEFAQRRDDMVVFLEVRWPWIVDAFNQRKSIESILQALTKSSPGGQDTWAYRKLIDHLDQLWEFLNSGRYTGEPRQIAYTVAGLPELKWRSSLDWGTKNPSLLDIHPAAFLDHIRRHNPKGLAILESQGATRNALKVLKECCAACRKLAALPNRVEVILQAGQGKKAGDVRHERSIPLCGK
jgi:hypothetical protein